MLTYRKKQGSLHDLKTYLPSTEGKLPPISEQRESKKNSTKELTQAIFKYTSANEKESLKNTDELLKISVSVLKAFGSSENNFQDLFRNLSQTVRRFCYNIDSPEIIEITSQYRIQLGLSFRKTVVMMHEELENKMKDKNEKIKQLSETIEQLNQTISVREVAWKEEKEVLVAEIEKYKRIANVEYMKQLEEEVKYQKGQIEEFTEQVESLQKKNDQYLKEIDFKDNTIHDRNYEIIQQKTDIFNLSKKLDIFDNYFHIMRDRFDGLLAKMMGIKEMIAKVEEENETLVSERLEMINRAAVSFTELTPRPKYSKIFNISEKAKINSTEKIFQRVIESSKMQNKQILDSIILKKKKDKKLKQAHKIQEQIVDDIIDAKKQMKKLGK